MSENKQVLQVKLVSNRWKKYHSNIAEQKNKNVNYFKIEFDFFKFSL